MEFLKAYINLLKTVLGSGILYIPMLYKHYGIIYATMLLVSACMFSTVEFFYFVSQEDLRSTQQQVTAKSNLLKDAQKIAEEKDATVAELRVSINPYS